MQKELLHNIFSKQDSAAEITDPQVGSQSEKEPIDQTIVVKRVFGWDAPSDVARLACFSYFAWRAIASFQSGGLFVWSIESMLESKLTSYLTDTKICCIN